MCMNAAWRIESGREGVAQAGESKVVLTNTEFKGECNICGKYGHKQNKCPKKKKSEEQKGNKKFTGKFNHCGKVEHKAANCCDHEPNKDKSPKNRKKKED